MTDHSNAPKMTYYHTKLNQAAFLYQDAIADEDGHKVIVDASKLKECQVICDFLLEQRNKIPLDIQAQASYFLAAGQSDEIARGHLAKAVLCCERFESQTGMAACGCEVFNEVYQQMLIAMGVEQSEFGGVAVVPIRHTSGRSAEGLLQARGFPTMKMTTSSATSGPRRKLPTVSSTQVMSERWGDEDLQN